MSATIPGTPPLVEQLKGGLDAPICLTWELTYACNLACVHCLSSSGRRDPDELTTAEAMSVVDQLAALQVFYVNMGGGEPMLRRDFFDIVEYSNADEWAVAQNGSDNEYNPDLWSRFDWTWNDGQFWFCQTVFDGATDDGGAAGPSVEDAALFVEDSWVGAELAVGERCVIRVQQPTVRCAMPLRAQPAGPEGPELERRRELYRAMTELHAEVPNHLGVYVEVVSPGEVAVGDPVVVAAAPGT